MMRALMLAVWLGANLLTSASNFKPASGFQSIGIASLSSSPPLPARRILAEAPILEIPSPPSLSLSAGLPGSVTKT